MRRCLFFNTFIFFALTIYTSSASNSIQIGTVVTTYGKVTKFSTTSKLKELLRPTSSIYEGDRIVTGKTGFIKILMIDETIVRIGNNSIFVFERFKFRSKTERKVEYVHKKGIARTLFTVKASAGDIKLKTPEIIANIEGTEVISHVTPVGKNRTADQILLLSGVVKLEFTSKKHKNLILKTGEMYKVDVGDKFSRDIIDKTFFKQLKDNPESISVPQHINLKKSDKQIEGTKIDSSRHQNMATDITVPNVQAAKMLRESHSNSEYLNRYLSTHQNLFRGERLKDLPTSSIDAKSTIMKYMDQANGMGTDGSTYYQHDIDYSNPSNPNDPSAPFLCGEWPFPPC